MLHPEISTRSARFHAASKTSFTLFGDTALNEAVIYGYEKNSLSEPLKRHVFVVSMLERGTRSNRNRFSHHELLEEVPGVNAKRHQNAPRYTSLTGC